MRFTADISRDTNAAGPLLRNIGNINGGLTLRLINIVINALAKARRRPTTRSDMKAWPFRRRKKHKYAAWLPSET